MTNDRNFNIIPVIDDRNISNRDDFFSGELSLYDICNRAFYLNGRNIRINRRCGRIHTQPYDGEEFNVIRKKL